MKILLLDIETAPMQVYAWSLWDPRIATNQIVTPGYTLCYAAQWLDDRAILFDSLQKSAAIDMIKGVHALLDEADAVCHYNGTKFDIPVLRGEFLQHRLKPPAPFKQIDLLTTMRSTGFPSKKLDYVAERLGLGRKLKHKGMELWHGCITGDEACWRIMEKYNKQDVRLLKQLHDELRPWIRNYPNRSTFRGAHICPVCGSGQYQQRGYAIAISCKYIRYQCKNCGKWFRSAEQSRGSAGFREIA